MGFFDDYEEDEQQPRRRKRATDDGRLDWQGMLDELHEDVEENLEEEEPLEEEDEMQELEVDDHGRIRNGGQQLDPSFWDEE